MSDIRKFKGDILVEGGIQLPNETASRVPVINGSNEIASSATTSTELSYLEGVTSSVQDQLDDKIPSSEKGANNGVATLDGGGKVPVTQLPSSVMTYEGTWDASTNTPTLANGTGDAGMVYLTSVAGTTDFGAGNITFAVGDWVIYNGTIWQKSENSNAVVSVNSQTGVVVLDTDDISEGTALYFTDERAQDAVGTILTDSSSIDFTYNDGAPSITAVVLPGGVDHDSLLNFVANDHVDHSSVSISTAANSGLTGGGDITTTRTLSVDITGTTALAATPDNADELLIWDDSASALRKVTVTELLSGVAVGSPGDIAQTSFAAANNVASPANVTGLAFANGSVRAFSALVSVAIDATSDLFEEFHLQGIQKSASWNMSVDSVGDSSGITFSITSAGQVQYTSTNVSGFVGNTVKFRAIVTNI